MYVKTLAFKDLSRNSKTRRSRNGIYSLTQVIIEKWTKIIYQMFESLKFQHGGDIMRSNLFYLAANCLKPNYFLTETTMSMVS